MTSDLLATLRSLPLDGVVVLPDDDGWEEARRVWNRMIDRQPVAVIRAASPTDVAAGIEVARDHGLPLAVRGGGHNVAGNGTIEDGLVIDLGPMHDVGVNPGTRIVTVEGGATLGQMDAATITRQTVVPAGVVSGTGIGGLTLGGGMGWLTRAHGLTIDTLLDAYLVTADGRHVHTSPTDEPDLFWGIRGGGGNFGVVTRFEFQGAPLPPEVYAGATWYGPQRWAEALRLYREWAPTIPDELTTIVTWVTPMEHWPIPDRFKGKPILQLSWCWAGRDLAEGERAVRYLLDARPDEILAGPTPWLELQSSADELFADGSRGYFKSTFFDEFSDGAIATLVEHAGRRSSPVAGVDIHQLGGRYARVPDEATAFGRRDAGYILNVWGVWRDAADDLGQTRWVRDFHAAMQPHANGGHYVNFLGPEDGAERDAQTRDSYTPETYARLVALKDRWDPGNLFRGNHNIRPSGA